MRRALSLAVAAWFALVSAAQAADLMLLGVGGGASSVVSTASSSLLVGGGGYVIGMDIAPDGTKVVQIDVYGGYYHGSLWQQIITASSLPPALVSPSSGVGLRALNIAYSNTQHFYAVYDGYLISSTNHGASWSQCNLAQFVADANDGTTRTWGPYLGVDPANENVVYVGTPGSGVYKGASGCSGLFSQIPTSTIAAGGSTGGSQNGGNIFAFDPSGGTTSGATNDVYVSSYGTGVYVTTNAGSTWALSSSGPTKVIRMCVDSGGGYLYAVANDANSEKLYILHAGTWIVATTGTNGNLNTAVACDPATPGRVVAGNGSGSLSVSADHGATWTDAGPETIAQAGPIGWLDWSQRGAYLGLVDLHFDPTQSNVLVMASGVGSWSGSPSNSNGAVTWTQTTAAQEDLVSNQVLSTPGGPVQSINWDRPSFYLGTQTNYPATYNPNDAVQVVEGYNQDYQGGAAQNQVLLSNGYGPVENSSYSKDEGKTWAAFAVPPPPEVAQEIGGGIAIDTAGDVVVFPCGGYAPYRSPSITGPSWTAVTGISDGGCNNYYLNRHIVAADKLSATTFYAYIQQLGTYKSTDGGQTWTRVSTTIFDGSNNDEFNAQLSASPLTAGDLFYTSGSGPNTNAFWHSTNGGATWTSIANVTEVLAFGFGAAAPTKTVASLWIAGYVNSVYGIWESDDEGATWSLATTYPAGSLSAVKAISGDLNRYGVAYVGTAGNGAYQLTRSNAVLKPIVANESAVTSTPTQATLTWASDTGVTNSINYGPTTAYGNTASASGGTSPSATLTGLGNYATIHWQAISANSAGTSQSYDNVFTTANTVPPSAPTALTIGTPTAYSIPMTWTGNQSPDPQPIASYQIFRNGTQVGTSPTASYTDGNLTPNTTYSYTIKAVDGSGNVSVASSAQNGTTGNGAVFAYVGGVQQATANSTTQTLTAVPIGTAASNRLVEVGLVDNAGFYATGVTIGGVTATQVKQDAAPTATQLTLWQALVPTGTTATIVVTLNAAPGYGEIGAIVGTINTTQASPTSTAASPQAYYNCPQSPTSSITVPTNGIAIGVLDTGDPSNLTSWNPFNVSGTLTFSGSGGGNASSIIMGLAVGGNGTFTPNAQGLCSISTSAVYATWNGP